MLPAGFIVPIIGGSIRRISDSPKRPDLPLDLLVIEGLGARSLVLLTTERSGCSKRGVWRLVESYLPR